MTKTSHGYQSCSFPCLLGFSCVAFVVRATQDSNRLISPDEFGHLLYAIFGYTYKKARKDAPSASLSFVLEQLYDKWGTVRW